MSRTVAEMVNKITSAGRTITSSKTIALRAMSDTAKTSVLSSAQRIAPDLNLSGVGKKGAKIGARVRISQLAEVKATGPWQLIEYDTKPRVITSRGLRGTIKSRQAAVAAGNPLQLRGNAIGTRLNTPAGPRFSVRHPGTKGQHPWRDGVNDVTPKLPGVAAKVYRNQIARIFR